MIRRPLPCSPRARRIFQGHGTVCIRFWTDIHIFYLRSDISQISRWLYAKTIQYILGLFIDLTGASWNITLGLGGSVFDICVSNCRTNRIRIRILMSHYKYFLILHSHSSFQNSADLCTLFICKQSFLFRVYFSNTLYRRFSFWAIVLIVQICTLY